MQLLFHIINRLLEFIDLRARVSESSTTHKRVPKTDNSSKKSVASFAASTNSPATRCIYCKTENHPLYHSVKFKALPHSEKLSFVRNNRLCNNCLKPGHMSKDCRSSHRCRSCQKSHHTLLHVDSLDDAHSSTVSSNTAAGVIPDILLMTFQALVNTQDGSTVKIRGLLDSASSASFISERLAQILHLPRSNHQVTISGIAGLSDHSPLRSVTAVNVSSIYSPGNTLTVTTIIIPQVTCNLPIHHVNSKSSWTHLSDLPLADLEFGVPGKIDLLLGVDVYADIILQGRQSGPPGTPTAFETIFGWVLSGKTSSVASQLCVTSHHISAVSYSIDDSLKKFWEVEEPPGSVASWSLEKQEVVEHFKQHHYQNSEGQYVVPLLKHTNVKPLGESRSQAVRRFMYLEQSLRRKNQHEPFASVMQEYFNLGHAEPVSKKDLDKPESDLFYLPLHIVYKESSTTTKVRAVFDASTKTASGISLNDQLQIGPTVHPPLVDVLLLFRFKRIAVTTDVSKMYRAIELVESDRDLHRFVWRTNPSVPIRHYRMTRVTFGVSASSFVANMCIKQNAANLVKEFPLAAAAVEESFYVDDGLTGADNVETAVRLQKELQQLFAKGGFLLHKWNSNDSTVLQHIQPELKDTQGTHLIDEEKRSTKTLGLQWETVSDQFRVVISQMPPIKEITKRDLISGIARIFDVLGWFSPAVIKVKILYQRLWEQKVDWDDPIPSSVLSFSERWQSELPQLTEMIPRCYYPKEVTIVSVQLHGFSDASEEAYTAAVYLRMMDTEDNIHTSLVTSKTKVSPIKKLTIPRLELCGALLLSRLLSHVKKVFEVPICHIYAWTDSTIVLSWLSGNPKRFKTIFGNRVATIIDSIPPDHWRHVAGTENPADCASRGLYPAEILNHQLWWNRPTW